MPARLIARLSDGSEHEVKVISGNPEAVLDGLTKSRRRWVEVIGGSVRYDNIVALLLVEEPAKEDRDRAITKLLRDLQARGGGSLEEVELELERRGIEIPERSRSAEGDPAEVSIPITHRRRDPSSREAD